VKHALCDLRPSPYFLFQLVAIESLAIELL